MRRHLEGMLNVCFDRDFNQRPSASDLLEHAYILSAPADHLMRQGSFESVNGEDGEDGEDAARDLQRIRIVPRQSKPAELGKDQHVAIDG